MSNINLRLSTGHSTNTNVASPNQSLGGKMALTASQGVNAIIPQNSYILGVLFDNISSSENMAEVPEYRCIYLENATGTNQSPFLGAKMYISGSTYAEFELGKANSKNIDASTIPDETTPPSLITFDKHTKDNKLILGDLNPGDRYAIWIKRTPKNVGGAGSTQEALVLIIEGSQ